MSEYTKETLKAVALDDVEKVWEKDVEYGRSWLKRGGVGAFMMLARKWDRIETQVSRMLEKKTLLGGMGGSGKTIAASPYDILAHIAHDQRAEGIIDDIRDLRRYLMLVEAHMLASGSLMLNGMMKKAAPAEPVSTARSSTGMERPFGYHAEEEVRGGAHGND